VQALGLIERWPVERAAAGAVSAADGVVGQAGDAGPFRWASVTKLLTAYAVLVAAEEGSLTLDARAGPPGSTVRHLLAHASGLPPEEGAPIARPGERRIYSNAGFVELGRLLAAAAEMPFAEYVRAAVLGPLELTATTVAGAAEGASGPLRDLLAFARELLAPRLVAPETLAEATAVAFPGLVGVLPGFGRQEPNDWGLGFELRDGKSPHWTGSRNSPCTFGHFGRSGSFLWVDPEAGVALAALADRDFGEWSVERWPELSDAVLAET
jgi:CubicO group peptidase (beta-lactamase class C family)